MKRFLVSLGRFFVSARFFKIVLWTVTIIVLFYVEEDWRGARAWAETQAKWEARGETFDLGHLVPPRIPREQNLAELPLFRLTPDAHGTLAPLDLRRARRDALPGGEVLRSSFGRWQAGYPPPIALFKDNVAKAYREVFHAEPPASSLEQLDALFPCVEELQSATATRTGWRPDPQTLLNWPFNFSLFTDQVPFSRLTTWHAIVALNEGRPDVALKDIDINTEIAAGLDDQPVLVTGLCAIALRALSECAIADGLRLHAWNDGQLAYLEDRLGEVDDLAVFQRDLRGECLVGAQSWWRFYPPLWPRGWDDSTAARWMDFELGMSALVDTKTRIVLVRPLNALLGSDSSRRERFISGDYLLQQTGKILARAAQHQAEAQAWLDETRLACALERYWLAHRAYPPSLDVLVPGQIAALPRDPMNGAPYHYHLCPDRTYLLYSVGWNQKDDGGVVVYTDPNHNGFPSQDYEQGDWVWPTSK